MSNFNILFEDIIIFTNVLMYIKIYNLLKSFLKYILLNLFLPKFNFKFISTF